MSGARIISTELTAAARDLAWGQWAQMGVSGAPPSWPEGRAADPEALLLFTFEIGRHDPRLFDEVLDWLVLNEQLISVQRLRNLSRNETDARLVGAALACVARFRPRARLAGKADRGIAAFSPVPLFPALSRPTARLDPAFERFGWLRPEFQLSEKSQRPDLRAPINFAFRMRRLLGIGGKAEIIRLLLTHEVSRVPFGLIEQAVAFARPNIRENIKHLIDSGVVSERSSGTAGTFAIDKEAWARLLQLDPGALPRHEDWIQLLGSGRGVLRWLHCAERVAESDYMRSSEARTLIDSVEDDLNFAGIAVSGQLARGADYWPKFEETLGHLARALRS